MNHNAEHDTTPQWQHAGDYATTKQKAGRDKRLHDKSQRKAAKAYRTARQKRHCY